MAVETPDKTGTEGAAGAAAGCSDIWGVFAAIAFACACLCSHTFNTPLILGFVVPSTGSARPTCNSIRHASPFRYSSQVFRWAAS